MNELDSVSLNTAHTFNLLQYQVPACIPPHPAWYRYCTVTLPKYILMQSHKTSGLPFIIIFCKYLDSILFPRKARWLISEKECYLFLTHNITICTNIFRHFIYVFQHLKFSKTCFWHFLQHSFKNRRSFVQCKKNKNESTRQ